MSNASRRAASASAEGASRSVIQGGTALLATLPSTRTWTRLSAFSSTRTASVASGPVWSNSLHLCSQDRTPWRARHGGVETVGRDRRPGVLGANSLEQLDHAAMEAASHVLHQRGSPVIEVGKLAFVFRLVKDRDHDAGVATAEDAIVDDVLVPGAPGAAAFLAPAVDILAAGAYWAGAAAIAAGLFSVARGRGLGYRHGANHHPDWAAAGRVSPTCPRGHPAGELDGPRDMPRVE
jgi:hypothetical protein